MLYYPCIDYESPSTDEKHIRTSFCVLAKPAIRSSAPPELCHWLIEPMEVEDVIFEATKTANKPCITCDTHALK
jgi:hypothetical protein